MVARTLAETDVWKILEEVPDPELPALSIVELNIIRSVKVANDEVEIEITPTFVGCPALDSIIDAIRAKMLSIGFKSARIQKNYAARWSTDMLGPSARSKLEIMGIAAPALSGDVIVEVPTACPYCKSTHTQLENPFGATLCKQLYYCNSCRQSFEKFRTL
jgi:ring-1,2-phenylacetyl-CoA epoxidase subunit PaaD